MSEKTVQKEVQVFESGIGVPYMLAGDKEEVSVRVANGVQRLDVEDEEAEIVSEEGKDWYKSLDVTISMDMM